MCVHRYIGPIAIACKEAIRTVGPRELSYMLGGHIGESEHSERGDFGASRGLGLMEGTVVPLAAKQRVYRPTLQKNL